MPDLTRLPAFTKNGDLNVIIETPKGSRNKFDYEPDGRLFALGRVLPPGAVFPFDFGFVPSTLAQDGDPLDVLVLMDAPAFPGCHIKARLVGVIEAEQTKDGKTVRNDRLIAVAAESHSFRQARALPDLPRELIDGIEHFFVSYNQMAGRQFKPLGRQGPGKAGELVADAERQARKARPGGQNGAKHRKKAGKA